MANSERLLSEFIDAWNAGRRPQVQDYLDHAPEEEREELAGLIAAFVDQAPTPAYSPETIAEIRKEPVVVELSALIESRSGAWPSVLPRLRRQAKLKREEVVAALAELLGVAGKEPKVAVYYHQMETGRLDPGGVSRLVLKALGKVLRVAPREIQEAGDLWRGPPETLAEVYMRAPTGRIPMAAEDRLESAPPPDEQRAVEWDEVDRLFRGGR
jgi:hypothetical protein